MIFPFLSLRLSLFDDLGLLYGQQMLIHNFQFYAQMYIRKKLLIMKDISVKL